MEMKEQLQNSRTWTSPPEAVLYHYPKEKDNINIERFKEYLQEYDTYMLVMRLKCWNHSFWMSW